MMHRIDDVGVGLCTRYVRDDAPRPGGKVSASQAVASSSQIGTSDTRARTVLAVFEVFSLDPPMNWLVIGCRNEESAL